MPCPWFIRLPIWLSDEVMELSVEKGKFSRFLAMFTSIMASFCND